MIVPLTLEYARYITENMASDDLAEILATHWLETFEGFAEQCVNASGINLCALANDGTPVAMGGIALFQPKVGTAWMVGTERMIEKRLEVTKHCKMAISKSLDSGLIHRVHAFASGLHHLLLATWLRNSLSAYFFLNLRHSHLLHPSCHYY